MSRQAGSIVRGNSKPRRISVKAGRQQVRLCTAGAAKGQGRRELARIDSRALLAAPVPPAEVTPGASPPRSVGVIPTDATAQPPQRFGFYSLSQSPCAARQILT